MSKQGTCWDGYVQKGMKKKGKKMVPNCVPAGMKEGGLTKWFNQKWVEDIRNVEENLQVDQKESIQSASLLPKQQA